MKDHINYSIWWRILLSLGISLVIPFADDAKGAYGFFFGLSLIVTYSFHESAFLVLKFCFEKITKWSWIMRLAAVVIFSLVFFALVLLLANQFQLLGYHKQKFFLTFIYFIAITTAHILLFTNAYYQANLMEELQQKKIILDEKYKALKSKGILHFLRNSLEATQKLIALNPKKALEQIDTLTKLLRSLLQSRDKDYIDLKEECELLNEFVVLLELQGNVRIVYEIESDPNYDQYEIPPFVLILIFDSIFINRSFIPYAELQVYVENGIYLVAKYQQLRNLDQENIHEELLHNLKQRYAFIEQDADVAIIATASHTYIKVPLLKPKVVSLS